MRYVRSGARLLLIGAPDVETYHGQLAELIDHHQLGARVKLLGWVSEEEKARLTADAGGALYFAYGEDSYGYSTLEAFHAHKPVITLSDSGGPLEVVQDSINGLVVEPDARAIAEALDQIVLNRPLARRMGGRAFESLTELNISWDYVTDRLLA
jgi:glycosyltransferase involved in cell wall biosynthesis